MKKNVFLCFFLISMPISASAVIFSGDGSLYFSDTDQDTARDDRVVFPAADPYVFYDPQESVFEFQSGMYAGTHDVGAEFTLMNRHYNFYATVFVSQMIRTDQRFTDARSGFSGGITFGRDFLLRTSADAYQDGTRFYARIGPGFGFSGISRIQNGSTERHFGLHTSALVGVTSKISNFGKPYIELGFRTAWFPTLGEIGLTAAPQISIGFQFSGSRGIVPVRF